MDNTVITTLAGGLDYGSARLQALSNNLTNVNTPGYKRKDVSFDALLHAAETGDDVTPTPRIVTEGGDAMRQDGNNVDVDVEAGRLAAAQIYYQGVAQLLQGQFAALKYVTTGGG